ncbi:MAG: alpha/beta fold hydrolase [Verrucomicrobiales bacterium]
MSSPTSLFRAAFVADALNLGPHWVYNQAKLTRSFPDGVFDLTDPLTNYHPGKAAGDFTHYGDQLLAQLQAYAVYGRWDQGIYEQIWRALWTDERSYQDGATKETLARLADPSAPPSMSNDTAGPARAILLLPMLEGVEHESLIEAVREFTAFTHGDAETVDTAELFARIYLEIGAGKPIPEAVASACQVSYGTLEASVYLEKARSRLDDADPMQVAADFGLTCHNPEALPLILYFLLRFPDDWAEALSQNALAGGDNAARAIPLSIFLTQSHGWGEAQERLYAGLTARVRLDLLLAEGAPSGGRSEAVTFPNEQGEQLHAVLELPPGTPKAYTIFAHCFTCGQSFRAARELSAALARYGIATLRFDFTGLGRSEGDFAETSFLTNVRDLTSAGRFLASEYQAATLLIGHSLGGTAVLAAAHELPEVKAVATVGAPAEPSHVEHLFAAHIPEIREKGKAEVELAGRKFEIGLGFLEAVAEFCQECKIAELKRDLLILHSPTDQVVGIENAGYIYSAAKHPKSFISLTEADHLLLQDGAARQVARLIAAWAVRSL